MATKKQANRTSQGLRDILFDEIEKLQGKDADPGKAMAVAHLARQIVNTAKVEMEFHREMNRDKPNGASKEIVLGSLQLGSS
jgi:hypothetical protein